MLNADLEVARSYLAHNPPPGTLLQCGISGAHLYGFPSPDSDLDLKGIHLAPTTSLLGLHPSTPPHDHTEVFRGVECDLTTNEAADALRLLVAGNGNMLERILSPLQCVDTPDVHELQQLAHDAISARFAKHYIGFLRGRRRELDERPSVKTLLYAYRVALTGIHLLRSGQLDPNLPSLIERDRINTGVDDLITMKRSGNEHAPLNSALLSSHRPALERLAAELEDAAATTKLPSQAPNTDEIERWLIARRMAHR